MKVVNFRAGFRLALVASEQGTTIDTEYKVLSRTYERTPVVISSEIPLSMTALFRE